MNQSLLAALAFLVLIVAFVLCVLHQAPIVHAQDIEDKSDQEQEVAYCTGWNRGTANIAGLHSTNMAIAEHCKQYLKQ